MIRMFDCSEMIDVDDEKDCHYPHARCSSSSSNYWRAN